MNRKPTPFFSLAIVASLLGLAAARAEVDNLRIVTDASPDYSDIALPSDAK